MNRTVLNSKKEDERALDDAVYRALYVLLKFYPGSEELHRVFKQEMFVKENSEAFIHIAHYLFCLLDPKEFEKRFYWPIRTKSDESHFRASSVEFINRLIDEKRLHFPKIKAVNVVHPGGEKFLQMLLSLICLVMEELGDRDGDKSLVLPETIQEQNKLLRDLGAKAKKLDDLDKKIKDCTSLVKKDTSTHEKPLKEMLLKVFPAFSLSEIEGFYSNLDRHIDQKFEELKESYVLLDKTLESFNQAIMKANQPSESSEKLEVLPEALEFLKYEFQNDISHLNDDEPFLVLDRLFHLSHPVALSHFQSSPLPSLEALKSTQKTLASICAKTINMVSESARLRRIIVAEPSPEIEEPFVEDHDIQKLLIQTPPMKISFRTDSSEEGHGSRLALLFDSTRFGNFSVFPGTPKTSKSIKPRLERTMAIQNETFRRPQLDTKGLLRRPKGPPARKVDNSLSPCSYSMLVPPQGSAQVFSSTVLDSATLKVPSQFISGTPLSPVKRKTPETAAGIVEEEKENLNQSTLMSILKATDNSNSFPSAALEIDTVREGREVSKVLLDIEKAPDLMNTSDNVLVNDSF